MTRFAAGRMLTLTMAVVVFGPAGAAAETCESLKSLSLPRTTITLAEPVNGGTFTPPENGAGGAARSRDHEPPRLLPRGGDVEAVARLEHPD